MSPRPHRGPHRERARRATVLSLLVLAAFTMFLAASAASAAPAAPRRDSSRAAARSQVHTADMSATASPNTGLVDYQVVDLSWSGYQSGSSVWFYTCSASATSVSQGCVTTSTDPLESVTGKGGTGIVRYQVRATSFGHFQCDSSDACYIAVLTDPNDLSSGGHATLSFAPPQGPCPGSKGGIVLGEGESSAAYTMYAWEGGACQLPSHPNISYTSDNSYDGMNHFVSGLAQFAGTGVPLDSGMQSQLKTQNRTYEYAPLTSSALVIAYNIVDASGHQVTNLNLTPEIVAEIANGSLSTFSCPASESDAQCTANGGDPNIRKLNPGINFPPGSINFFARAEQSSETLEFTSWLTATDPAGWPTGPTQIWPEGVCQTCGVQGAGPQALAVGFPQTYQATNIYIGVMDSTWAHVADLPAANIANPGVAHAVAPTAASVSASLADATANADGTLSLDYTTSDPNAYPMPNLMYGVLPTSVSCGKASFSGADGAQLKDFLGYAMGTSGQGNLPSGSYPLPSALVTQTQTAMGKIPTSGGSCGGGGDGGGGGGGGGSGTGTGFGTGTSGVGTTTTPPPGGPTSGTSPTPTPSPTVFVALGAHLSSPASSSVIPLLASIAILGLLIGPLILLVSRAAPRVVSATSGRASKGTRARGKNTPPGNPGDGPPPGGASPAGEPSP